MSELQSIFTWPVTIYYEDTDAGGIVYHANYLKYFERARTEMLRSQQIGQQQLLETQIGFVVRHIDIDFKQGAKLDEMLTVETVVSELKRASLQFCQKLVNDQGKVLCTAIVKVACINHQNMKPIAIPQTIHSALTKFGANK